MTSPTIESLNSRHYKILDFCILGLTQRDIASRLSMSTSQLSIIINSPSFQHELAIRRSQKEERDDIEGKQSIDSVKNALREGALEAANKLVSGMHSDDEKIGLHSASEILDRTGYAKEIKTTGPASQTPVIILSSEDIERLRESLALDNTETENRPESNKSESSDSDTVSTPDKNTSQAG